jgi:hypothetical protein
MVCDASRWSRDNRKSKDGLDVLRNNGIRFFIGTMEMDLFKPYTGLMLGMSVEIGEFHAKEQAYKSMLSRIERAKRNIPSAGRPPFGRKYDKKKGKWIVDKEKKRQIEYAAEQYLSGVSLAEVAKKLNMNHPNLAKLLRERCGDKWTIQFDNEDFNIHETVTLTIPRLLPQSTIKAIHARARANRTFFHGQTKNRYLLGRVIFCGHCGFALFGQFSHNKIKYYRHPRERGCKRFNSVPAGLIEDAVFAHLFELFGDRVKIEEAAKQAIPDLREVKRLRAQIERSRKELKKIPISKERLLDKVEKGIIEDEDLQDRWGKLKEREQLLKAEIDTIQSKLSSVPTEEEITRTAQIMQRVKESFFQSEAHLKEMSFEHKRALLQNLFGGTDKDGKRYGVYVEKMKKKGLWVYTIRGAFIEEVGRLEKTKQSKQSKRDAYNSIRLYKRR